jgi:PAS domain S-box-containing protein
MAPTEREQRLQFLGLTKRDEQLLRDLRPLFQQHVPAVEDAFYEQLLSFPETAQLLRDHTTVERLKKLQREYLMRIVEGNFDDAYFADRLRIGQTHERVGLQPRWYLLAYNLYFNLFSALIREFYRDDPMQAQDSIVALEKVFTLDASLAMDAYIASDRYRQMQQLESIVNDSADVIFFLDTEKRFRAWNRAAERTFGWRAEEIIGKPLSVILPPEVLAAGEIDAIDRQIHAHGHYHFESVRMAKDGRRVPVEATISLLRNPQGNPMGRSAILRDITERKRLEEAKLHAERLAVVGAMSAKLAHEIRNPLSSVILNLDLARDEIEKLAKDDSANEARALLDSIGSEVRRIQRVTEDYLKFARLPKPRRGTIGLNALLEEQLAFMQSLFDAAGVKLRTEFAPSLPAIHADEEQLWQAILNLIRNALEAMPAGGTLTLSTAAEADGPTITITDTGKGMTKEELDQIFKPFFSTKTGGTGLGLPLTQQIVAEHGGRIDCRSVPRKGTTFIIHLPRAPETSHGKKS